MLIPLRDAVTATCGAKAGSLGELLRAGLAVPDGVVIPFAARRDALGDDPEPGPGSARPEPYTPGVPPPLQAELARQLDALGNPPVAVRSSAADEDTADVSAAGRYRSVLAVRGTDQVVASVRACWASLHAHTEQGGNRPGVPTPTPAMAVVVHQLIDADVSGVTFTGTGADVPTRIEAAWGLGPSTVGGTVTPDAYGITEDGSITRTVADKATRLDRRGDGLVTSKVPPHWRHRPTLDDATVTRLAVVGAQIADLMGAPQDIEWAIADGRIWILQARPVTAALPAQRPPHDLDLAGMTGAPGSNGVVTGTARIITTGDDAARVRPGDVLVCPWTTPAWMPLLRIAAGVVTEVGGVLSHAAIVARERRIPAVLGITDATTRIRDGDTITIDGSTGIVTTDLGGPT